MDAQGWAMYCYGLIPSVHVDAVPFGCDDADYVFEYLYVRSAAS